MDLVCILAQVRVGCEAMWSLICHPPFGPYTGNLVRLVELETRVGGEVGSSGASSADEEMLDWVALSVENGWTPRGVLLCFPPVAGEVGSM